MCLMLYIGCDKPLTEFKDAAGNGVFLKRASKKRLPTEIANKKHTYLVTDGNCSCGLLALDRKTRSKADQKICDHFLEIITTARRCDRKSIIYSEWLGGADREERLDLEVEIDGFSDCAVASELSRGPLLIVDPRSARRR